MQPLKIPPPRFIHIYTLNREHSRDPGIYKAFVWRNIPQTEAGHSLDDHQVLTNFKT